MSPSLKWSLPQSVIEDTDYSYVLYEDVAEHYFPDNLSPEQLCWVLKSKGTSGAADLFMRARVIQDEKAKSNIKDRRVLVRYPKGSEYRVRRSNLIPVLESHRNIVLVMPETPIYRRACVIHTVEQDAFLEIGCSFGPTVSRIKSLCTSKCLGIDKGVECIEIAENQYPDCMFRLHDVLEEPMDKLAMLCHDTIGRCPSVVAIDINGNRELPAVLQCLGRILNPDASSNWKPPRLVIVKSRSLYGRVKIHGNTQDCQEETEV